MNLPETKIVLGTLRAAFPSFYKDMGQTELSSIVNLWQKMFADDDYKVVIAAAEALIATKVEGYPPTIGAVKDQIAKRTQPEELSEQEAWALVSKACSNGYWGFKEEFDKLPEVVQRAVGGPEQLRIWAQMDSDTVESVVASNFMRSFRVKQKNQKELSMIPESVRQVLSAVADKMKLNVAEQQSLPAPKAEMRIEIPKESMSEAPVIPKLDELFPESRGYVPLSDEEFEEKRNAALRRLSEL